MKTILVINANDLRAPENIDTILGWLATAKIKAIAVELKGANSRDFLNRLTKVEGYPEIGLFVNAQELVEKSVIDQIEYIAEKLSCKFLMIQVFEADQVVLVERAKHTLSKIKIYLCSTSYALSESGIEHITVPDGVGVAPIFDFSGVMYKNNLQEFKKVRDVIPVGISLRKGNFGIGPAQEFVRDVSSMGFQAVAFWSIIMAQTSGFLQFVHDLNMDVHGEVPDEDTFVPAIVLHGPLSMRTTPSLNAKIEGSLEEGAHIKVSKKLIFSSMLGLEFAKLEDGHFVVVKMSGQDYIHIGE